jgi:hypothetical protein
MLKFEYEQYKPVRQVWTWLAVLLLSAITIGWGLLGHAVVRQGPRHWDYGTLPDAPAQSPYSTVPPPRAKAAPVQIELPPDFTGRT